MSTATDLFASYGYALALAAHAGFAMYLVVKLRPAGSAPPPERLFLGALSATALWAAASFAGQFVPSFWIQAIAVALDLARYGLWFFFLLAILGPAAPGKEPSSSKGLGRVALACLAGATGLEALGALGVQVSGLAAAALTTHLALPLCGLVMVEQVFRSLRDDSRWSAKPACLGLACVFVFDIYLYAEGLMFGTFDRDALNVRGLVHTLAVPFLFVASRRGGSWMARLHAGSSTDRVASRERRITRAMTGCAERASRAVKDFDTEEAERLLLHRYTGLPLLPAGEDGGRCAGL